MSNDHIVVYHSEFERAMDQWFWNGDGWIYLALISVAILLGVLVCWGICRATRKPWE
jgi:hypothetical protein